MKKKTFIEKYADARVVKENGALPLRTCLKATNQPTTNPLPPLRLASGRYIEVVEDGSKRELKKAAITLTDCLACSGCVTSAESVLVDMQTYKVAHELALHSHPLQPPSRRRSHGLPRSTPSGASLWPDVQLTVLVQSPRAVCACVRACVYLVWDGREW
jgi:hypothetical protein